MPEGDTVYATAHRLTEALAGVTLVRGELRHPRLSTVDLKGRVLERAVPVGKHLFLRFDGSLSLHCHLRMDGSWRIYTGRAPITHRTRAVLGIPGTTAVGNLLMEMALLSTSDEYRLVDHLGPDLLAPDWADEHQAEAVRRLTEDPARPIGEALLDQTVMAGVGNVYKAEVCFLLGVSPWTPVSDVDVEKTVRVARKLLLRNALRTNRNTTGDPRRGRDLWVYGRARQGCLRCTGRLLVLKQDTRTTYHCPHCQPGPNPP
ncbi:MAG: DNA-formamidopyrimidine glycosylase family protein [Actinophytocola sp.]|uniref:Fpg/Nei family DNA glycosylase n=1 Tax=Actinophytocola sp. TaxID=1872138 RepID=UPI003C72BE5F